MVVIFFCTNPINLSKLDYHYWLEVANVFKNIAVIFLFSSVSIFKILTELKKIGAHLIRIVQHVVT